MSRTLRCGAYTLKLDRPLVMGIVNITPDSFFDGGRYADTPAAVAQARKLIDEGADLIDIGGESTRPGAPAVSLDDERSRVLPVIEALADCGVPISVDTQKPELMKEAIGVGASFVNDVNALRAAGALEAVAATGAGVCLMHMKGDPRTMQQDPRYNDVVAEVRAFLAARIEAAERAGVARERIVIDPGFGFGKTVEHNLALLRHLSEIGRLDVAVLAGLSRKSTLGKVTGRGTDERIYAGVAAALLAVQNGAQIVRVHDVAATRDALAVWNAVRETT